jgi:MFS family permease
MSRPRQKLLPAERVAVVGLATILSLRMLGFYAVLPILSTHAATLPGASPVLIGMSVGGYALTQALFQVPLGMFSDRYGRPRAIVIGLLVFAIGSIIAGGATTVWWLLLGRLVQGAGAVASVLIALAADVTRPVARTRAMGSLGVAIGLSLGLGMGFGPMAASWAGVSALFNLTGILSLAAILYVMIFFRNVPKPKASDRVTLRRAVGVFPRPELMILNFGTMAIHLTLTCVFVVLPFAIEKHFSWGSTWQLYPPVIFLALGLMYLSVRRADHPGWARPLLWMGVGITLLTCAGLFVLGMETRLAVVLAVVGFMAGVAITEPILPALVTRYAAADVRGTAAGVFNVFQFTGSFLGGILGGKALGFGPQPLFGILAAALLVWLLVAFRLPSPFRVEIARRRKLRRSAEAASHDPA